VPLRHSHELVVQRLPLIMDLTRQRRLRQWAEFHAVRTKGHSAAGRYVVIGALTDPSLDGERKFGFVTSKKAGKKAVTRNLLRRRFRHIVRDHGDMLLPDQMVVTIARWQAATASFAELEKDWLKVVKRLKIWQKESL